jgi:2,4-dienoyl-CoA reductase-like NADH-dependent reductase (Old Yellow Enzyme family)
MLGEVEVRNRIALAPMGLGLCNSDGRVTKESIAFTEARANGGVGLIISQA